MTQEQKAILFKDLCGRLPHGVKILVNDKVETVQGINILDNVVEYDSCLSSDIEEVRPYLFPLSSMTREQREEFVKFAYYEPRLECCGRHQELYYYDLVGHENNLYPNSNAIDWLNKNHFDYRSLIPIKLAIDATGLNIY